MMKSLCLLSIVVFAFFGSLTSSAQAPPDPGGASAQLYCFYYSDTWSCHSYDAQPPAAWGTGDCEESGLCDAETASCSIAFSSKRAGDWGGQYNTIEAPLPEEGGGRQIDMNRTHWITCGRLYVCQSHCEIPDMGAPHCVASDIIPEISLGGFAYILEDENCSNVVPAPLPGGP